MLWTAVVTKDKPFVFETPYDLRITTACLGNSKVKQGERFVLSITHMDLISEENKSGPICVFIGGVNEFFNLDLVADEGEPFSFSTTGDATIHLTGYYLLEDDEEDDEDALAELQNSVFASDSDDEEFTPVDVSMDSVDISDSDSDNVAPAGKIEVLDDDDVQDNILEKVKQKQEALAKKRKDHPTSGNPPNAKKQKTEPVQSPKGKGKNEPAQSPKGKAEPTTPKDTTPKGKGKNQPKEETPKGKAAQSPRGKNEPAKTPEKKAETPKGKPEPKSPSTPQKKTAASPATSPATPSGKGPIGIEILTPSSNTTTAKKGSKIKVKYVGRLANSKKEFDKGVFEFQLGAGKVIKGWDMGLVGMPVGEKRKLTIPPKFAYGSTKMDGIPANSTLEFEVELIKA